eukprot:135370-Pyramimonas_sp.AAC.1
MCGTDASRAAWSPRQSRRGIWSPREGGVPVCARIEVDVSVVCISLGSYSFFALNKQARLPRL